MQVKLALTLIGDHLYGGDTSKYDHQLLHASKISFNDPFTLKQMTFTSELPAAFFELV